MIKFNPIKNKFPKGAINNEENFQFEVLIKDDFYFNDFKIVIKNEFTGEIITKSLSFKEKTNENYMKYSVNFEPFNIGLYFYHFEVHFDSFYVFLKNDRLNAKLVNNIGELPDWQLTVYDSNFTTPLWYKGSIMYQIFPDRFKRSVKYDAQVTRNENIRMRHENWNDIPHSSITHENYGAKDFLMGNLLGIEEEKEYFKKLNIESI